MVVEGFFVAVREAGMLGVFLVVDVVDAPGTELAGFFAVGVVDAGFFSDATDGVEPEGFSLRGAGFFAGVVFGVLEAGFVVDVVLAGFVDGGGVFFTVPSGVRGFGAGDAEAAGFLVAVVAAAFLAGVADAGVLLADFVAWAVWESWAVLAVENRRY